jgi:hypothetical protein
MKPLHPSCGKDELFELGLARALDWLDAHNLPRPAHVFRSREDANKHRRNFMPKTWYGAHIYEDKQSTIAINLKRCRVATRVPGWSWTFPGYKSDLTPFGIVCHEFGHHVDHTLGGNRGISYRKPWQKIILEETEVSGYEPNHHEAFAEAFRLFLTNPDLLRCGRPERWSYFVDKLQLVPPDDSPWQEVLRHAHPRIVAAAKKWIDDD